MPRRRQCCQYLHTIAYAHEITTKFYVFPCAFVAFLQLQHPHAFNVSQSVTTLQGISNHFWFGRNLSINLYASLWFEQPNPRSIRGMHTNSKGFLRVDGMRKKAMRWNEMICICLMHKQRSLLCPFWVACFIKGQVKQTSFNLYGHRGPKIGKIQRKVSTTSIKIVMHVINLSSSKILQGWNV